VGESKVGIIGLVDLNYTTTTIFNVKELILEDPIVCAKRYVKILQEKKCDYIIALTHMLNLTDENLIDSVPGL